VKGCDAVNDKMQEIIDFMARHLKPNSVTMVLADLLPSICIQNIYMVVSCRQKHRLAIIAEFNVRHFSGISTDQESVKWTLKVAFVFQNENFPCFVEI
jgi:hypothetical protein